MLQAPGNAAAPAPASAASADETPLPDGLIMRDLKEDDYDKGYLDLLAQLTSVGEVSSQQFKERFAEVAQRPNDYRIVVIEDPTHRLIVATGTLLVERKFIHGGGKIGHLEDVVVHGSMRGKHLGMRIIWELTRISKEAGCYKVILDCAEKNTSFYEKCGFEVKNVGMALYFSQ